MTTESANTQTTESKPVTTPDPSIAASKEAEWGAKVAAAEARAAAAEQKAQQSGRVQELLNAYSNGNDDQTRMQAGRELLRLQGVSDEEAAKVLAEQFGQNEKGEQDDTAELMARVDMTSQDITRIHTDLLKTRINDMINEKALAAAGASGTLLSKITKIKGDKASEQAKAALVEAIRRETVAKLRQLTSSGAKVSLEDVNAAVSQADRKAADSFGAFFHEGANLGSAPAPVPDWVTQVKAKAVPKLPTEGSVMGIAEAEDAADAYTNHRLLTALAEMDSDTSTKA